MVEGIEQDRAIGAPDGAYWLDPSETTLVRTRDGVGLATDIYLPEEAASRRVPAVLVRLPYDKRGQMAFLPGLAAVILARGWALVAQDVRGKFASDGSAAPFVHEVADGQATLSWIERQPWSNGRVIAAGDSYFGFTAWAAAASGHRALVGIAPRLTTTRIADDWMYRNGVFRLAQMTDWAGSTWSDRGWVEVMPDWTIRPFADVLPAALGRPADGPLDRWATTPPENAWWRTVELDRRALKAIRVPVLHVGGWYDIFLRGQLADWRQAGGAAGDPGLSELVVDAVDHVEDPLLEPGVIAVDPLADPGLRAARLGEDFAPLLAFLERLSGARPRDGAPRVRYHHAGLGWRSADVWPPSGAATRTLYPVAGGQALLGPEGGLLADRPERVSSVVRWTHDPSHPVPSLDLDVWRPLLALPDEREAELRDDVVTFTGPELHGPLDLAGPARLRAIVASSAPSTHLMAKLVDVFPNGWARRIAEGALLVRTSSGEAAALLDLGDAAYRLPAGHRLRLEIASSAFPRYIVHPGTDEDPWRTTRTATSAQSLRLGGEATVLEVTVLIG